MEQKASILSHEARRQEQSCLAPHWRDLEENKSGYGSSITWDFTPVPTGPCRTVILPYEERKADGTPQA